MGIAIAHLGAVSDRRRYKRYRLTEAAESTVRVFPDVAVTPHGEDEWIAMGREAGVPGETLILDIVRLDTGEGELRLNLQVCVIDSRPIIVDGDVRHWIKLRSGTLATVRSDQGSRG